MKRKEKLAFRQHQSTRQIMGIQRITAHGVTTERGEMVFFLVRPDNLTVLSAEGVRARITALTNLLRAEPAVELMALDSRESFQPNKAYYQARLDKDLDEIQSASASAREFLLILRPEGKAIPDEAGLRQMEKALCDHGISVHLAEEQDVKRLLAVYYQHDVTTDFFEDADGERMVNKNA